MYTVEVDINWSWIEIKIFGSGLFSSSYFISSIEYLFIWKKNNNAIIVRKKPSLVKNILLLSASSSLQVYANYATRVL